MKPTCPNCGKMKVQTYKQHAVVSGIISLLSIPWMFAVVGVFVFIPALIYMLSCIAKSGRAFCKPCGWEGSEEMTKP